MKTTRRVFAGLFAVVAGLVFGLNAVAETAYDPEDVSGWKLSWADEFNGTGQADTSNWGYEKGKVRNNEKQTYIEGSNNAWQENDCLVIEARKNDVVPGKGGKSTTYDYTSASLITKGKRSFLYGKYIFRAKIPTFRGAWPCMWTMGVNGTWPCGGEIDIQEMYWTTVGDGKQGPTLMCNCTWKAPGGDQYNAIWQDGFNWNRYKIDTLDPLGADNWSANFHTWVMDWDKDFIRVYMDGKKLLDMDLTKAINAGDAKTYPNETPYHYAQYILLNFPFGGDAGGQCGFDDTAFPSRMLVDYVRVYRKPGTTDGLVGGISAADAAKELTEDPPAYNPEDLTGYELSWADEFDGVNGKPDPDNWSYETGFVRNHEAQYYTDNNACCTGGVLNIEVRKERVKNQSYSGQGEWYNTREYADYTSSSLASSGKRHFLYGKYIFRAKIPTTQGMWPCMWFLGTKWVWPASGEIDVQEFYWKGSTPTLLCNEFWSGNSHVTERSIASLDPDGADAWSSKFHTWVMDWDEQYIRIYLDGSLLNETKLDDTINWSCEEDALQKSPFRIPQYMLLDLPVGGDAGGSIDDSKLPQSLIVDYVRVYRKVGTTDGLQKLETIDTTPGEGPEYEPTASDAKPTSYEGYKLFWHDECNGTGSADSTHWTVDNGNGNSANNVTCANGLMTLMATKPSDYAFAQVSTWGKHANYGQYTNGYPRLEFRARLPVEPGTRTKCFIQGRKGDYPACGLFEVFDCEYVTGSPCIFFWGTPAQNDWYSKGILEFIAKEPKWAAQFHTWRLDWSASKLSIYIDDELFFEESTSDLSAGGGCPFIDPENALDVYFQICPSDGGADSGTAGQKLEIDWVRYYIPGAEEEEGGGDDPQEVDPTLPDPNDAPEIEGYVLSWSDEFNGDNVAPDSSNWDYELGYKVRNDESQVYVRDNAVCADGRLMITVKKEQTTFDGKTGEYSSSSIVTKGNRSFLYGKYIFRARVPMAKGTWPCMWMMGRNYTWPSGGEIDIQEYYWSGNTHWMKCNLCWNGDKDMYATEWNSQWYDITSGFGGVDAETWGNRYHVWTMDWTPERITIDVDGVQLLDQDLSKTLNKGEWGEETQGKSPFNEPQYILLNLPVGGVSGGWIDDAALPQQLEVDYVRCYRLADRPNDGLQPPESFNTTPGTGPEFVADTSAPSAPDGYKLCWNDEFDEGTQPAASRWNVQGNTHDIANGLLTMTATESQDWGMIDTKGIRSFTNGIIEVRARIPVAKGVYTTMWTESLNDTGSEPYGFAEFLDSRYLAGSLSVVAWINWWDSEDWYDRQLTMFTAKDPDWAAKFHVWKYIIDDNDMTILIDDKFYYKRARSTMIHQGECPFGCEANPHYLALCLKYNPEAILDPSMLPAKLDIDYVRCYVPGEEDPGSDEPIVDPPTEPVEQPTNATMQTWFAYTAATEQVVGGAWQTGTEDGVKVFLPTASSKDGDLVYVDVKAKFPTVAATKLPSSVSAQGALSAADGYLYVFAADGWTKLANATVAADTEKSYRVEFDYGSENAPRLRVWEVIDGGFAELKDANGTSWFALTANTFKCFTSLSFSGDGTIGDFIGTCETGPRVVVTIEVPSFTDADGKVKGGVSLRTVGDKNVFSVTIANGKKGAHYTAFVANTLSADLQDWTAVAASVSPDADGLLTLDIIRDDSPAKFAKIVATPTEVAAGTKLSELAQ